MSMMVIDFNVDGAVQAMHRENVLPLGFLGRQDIKRATDIRFDADTQSWGIWPRSTDDSSDPEEFSPPPCDAAKGFATYETARDVEVAWLERCRLVSVTPASREGRGILSAMTPVQN